MLVLPLVDGLSFVEPELVVGVLDEGEPLGFVASGLVDVVEPCAGWLDDVELLLEFPLF